MGNTLPEVPDHMETRRGYERAEPGEELVRGHVGVGDTVRQGALKRTRTGARAPARAWPQRHGRRRGLVPPGVSASHLADDTVTGWPVGRDAAVLRAGSAAITPT